MLFDFLRDRETIKELRKELGAARRELEAHEFANWKAAGGWIVTDPRKEHSVAHFDLTEPKIKRREHSDVFKIDSIDALIAGTRR